MNLKTNLLALAISATFLTACGGSSSSSSNSNADIDTDTSPEVLLDYSLTDNDLLQVGKDFIANVDLQTAQLAGGLGSFTGGVVNAIAEKDEDGVPQGLKEGLYLALGSMEVIIESIYQLRSAGNFEIPDEELGFFSDSLSDDSVTYTLTREGVDGLKLNVTGTQEIEGEVEGEPSSEVSFEYELIFTNTSSTGSKVVVSGSLEEVSTGLNVTFTDLSFEAQDVEFRGLELAMTVGAEEEEVLPKAIISFGEISAELDGVAVTAGLNAHLVGAPSGAATATLNTLENNFLGDLELSSLISALTGLDYVPNGDLLNLETLEITDLRIDVTSGTGEYVTADSILYEDADAAEYSGAEITYDAVAYEFNEAGDQLVLTSEFGTTTYTYTAATVDEFEESIPAQLSCVSVDEGFFGAPRLNIYCTEDGVDVYSTSLLGSVGGAYLSMSGASGVYFPADPELSGNIAFDFYPSMDSIAEPISFSISANGEFGFVNGEVVPYQLSLNHPAASDYQLQAVIGEEATALSASYGSLEGDFLLSSSVPFIPEDSDFAPTTADVELVFNPAPLYMMGPMLESELDADSVVVGGLTVNGVTVADLKVPMNMNQSVDNIFAPIYIEFIDETYPETGGLFKTVEEMIIVDCPASDEASEIGVSEVGVSAIVISIEEECFSDQEGVFAPESLFEAFFEGLSTAIPGIAPVEEAIIELD